MITGTELFKEALCSEAALQIPFKVKVRAVEIASRFIDGRFEEQDLKDYEALSILYPETAKAIQEVLQNEEP